MALLGSSLGVFGLVACSASLLACSAVVDAGSLHAERMDVIADSASSDVPVAQDLTETTSPNDVAVAPEDIETTTDVVADVEPPLDIVDAQGDLDTQMPTDVEPIEELKFTHTGALGCVLDYSLIPVTNCPKTCNWEFSFDASDSVGIQSFGWRFSVTGGYTLTGASASGPTPKVTITTPPCGLFDSSAVGPAKILVEVSTNGSPFEVVKTVDFAVRQVSSCPASLRPECSTP